MLATGGHLMPPPERKRRLVAVDEPVLIVDYEAGATTDTICAAHQIGLPRLCRILDGCTQ